MLFFCDSLHSEDHNVMFLLHFEINTSLQMSVKVMSVYKYFIY